LKSFHNSKLKLLPILGGAGIAIVAMGWGFAASGSLPSWIRNIEAGTSIEAVFFRAMPMPGGAVLFRRPPSETRPALGELIKAGPKDSELYSLRALEDEQQLDIAAAESDWKLYAENASDKAGAQTALADFYHRRLRPLDEIKTLSVVAAAPADASESLVLSSEQRSWRAFERIFDVIRAQGLPKDVSIGEYRAWLARYPHEPSLYARYLEFLISEKEYTGAEQLIAEYHKQFPGDEIFPVKAKALVEYRRGSLQQGLAVYEQSFQPLWAPELVKGYFDLLAQTQSLRKFLDQSRAALNANPEDLNAAARIFYYYQQQGKLDAAEQVIAEFRLHKEATKSPWTSQDLYVCARLLEDIHSYPESARYYFALYNSKGTNDAQEQALAGLANLLLTAPETPIRLGSGELSMYRDIATMDQGPGYLNGILSLILNTTSPPAEYSEEEQRAFPYFHRSRAAELLALLDDKYPNSPERPELHAKLLDFYAHSGESEAVIKGGRDFLAAFPHASERIQVALLMADAYARTGKTQDEFAIYDSVLQELAAQADKVPLGTSSQDTARYSPSTYNPAVENDSEQSEGSEEGGESGAVETRPSSRQGANEAFDVGTTPAQTQAGARSPEYARILERYLARLGALKQVPAALAVLRREIDRNPDDPGLYERLAVFLDQNRLGSEQEEIYRRAMARFPDRSWYHKLARFYLRYKRNEEFERLTQDAVKTFTGTDLENYFQDTAYGGGPALYLRLNEYAHRRFPHNPVFVLNLLSAYHNPQTYDNAAWESLLRQHWFEEPDLRNRFFEYLSWSGKLESELSTLQRGTSADGKDGWTKFVREDPAAGNYLAQADLWRSHFEDSAPVLKALAEEYPADQELGRTASSVYRSLAYFDPDKTVVAAKFEENLLQANPGNTEILARIGDIYADRDLLAEAAPYWERIPQVAPGQSDGYLEAATIYWDYYDFGNALRLLGEGRKKLNDDNLFSYEAGAIYENQRDYPRAIEEYIKGAVAAGVESPAGSRLLELARRPKFRDLVNNDTAKAAAPPNPSTPALNLRVAVLEAQDRKPELESYLESIIQDTTSLEKAENIEDLAQRKSLEAVRQHALEKQAVLATDPVKRLQLRYALVSRYESRKDFQSAQRNIEALYRENPKILGVVRSTVDFYWRMKLRTQAISVLLQAAKDAYPDLSKQFRYEAARKSTDAGQYQQARDLLASLIKDAPYDSQYLAAMADTFGQAGDDRGLQQFYLEKIALFRDAPLSQDDRKTMIATLRHGLIPALTRMKDYPGAVDQYIELINGFPEDGELVTEAALYALRYQRQQQLTDFYSKTIFQSPRDFHWPMVLARIQTSLEDFPGAIDTYQKSLVIRPDRVDLREARAGLEERLMRFDEAAADYDRVYQLAYKDPQWMEKIAEIRARQGRVDDVVAALKTARIEGRPENADNYFEVARRLESWGMLAQARVFAEQGVSAAGGELLAAPEHHEGAKLYARIMTRLRQQEKAYAILQSAMSSASSSLPVIKEQLAKEGVEAVTDSEWRQRTQQMRIEAARGGMRDALREMGGTVARYFTPEEKVSFAQFAQMKHTGMDSKDVETFAVPLAQSAGLADLEARWDYELMMERGADPAVLDGRMNALVGLQRRRLKFAELASQLESFAPRIAAYQHTAALSAASTAYRSAGDPENELRVLEEIPDNYLGQDQHNRLFYLLLNRNPHELVNRASIWNNWGQSASDYAVAHGDPSLVHAVVAARGRPRPPVWLSAYNGLVGLYFSEPSPEVNAAFLGALGDDTIAQRLAKPVDRTQQLAGNTWFYYGSRYGEYLGVTKQGNPEDYLPSELEESPASADAYLTLADYYAGSGDTRAAIADYNHTLDLTPGRADVHDRMAIAYYKQGQRAEAVAQWKQVFATLLRQVDSVRVPETFWNDFANSCDHLHSYKLFSELRPDADAVLRAYLRRNGNYRSNVLLHSAFAADGDPAAATAWLLDLATVAHDSTVVLSDVVEARWIPLAQRAPIYQRILESSQNATLKAEGLEKESAQSELQSWQVRWVKYLTQMKEYAQASDAIAALPQETRDAEAAQLVPLDLQVAAQLGTLDSKIAGYRSEPQTAPASELLRTAARQLFESGDKQSARKLLEFVFAREIDEHKLIAANFLGLAEIRIAAGDTPGAMDLLRRLVAVVGNPFENLEPSAALLEKTGHNAEAIEFLDQLVKSAPWEPAYRLRLAKAKIAAGKDAALAPDALVAIASSGDVPYRLRVETAVALAGARPQAKLGSGELDLLAGDASRISIAAADQPFYYDARLSAGQTKIDAQRELQLLASALADTPDREDVRIPLFETAASLQDDEYAVAVLEPLHQQFLLGRLAPPGDEEQEIIGSDEEENTQEEVTSSPRASAKLLPPQQTQIAWEAGNVMVRLDRLNEALPYLQLAGKLEKASARHKEIESKIAEVKSSLRRQKLNAARQPILHEPLEQDRVVRPRLVARALPRTKPVTKGSVMP
jgi:predicted Zn-dependent protease